MTGRVQTYLLAFQLLTTGIGVCVGQNNTWDMCESLQTSPQSGTLISPEYPKWFTGIERCQCSITSRESNTPLRIRVQLRISNEKDPCQANITVVTTNGAGDKTQPLTFCPSNGPDKSVLLLLQQPEYASLTLLADNENSIVASISFDTKSHSNITLSCVHGDIFIPPRTARKPISKDDMMLSASTGAGVAAGILIFIVMIVVIVAFIRAALRKKKDRSDSVADLAHAEHDNPAYERTPVPSIHGGTPATSLRDITVGLPDPVRPLRSTRSRGSLHSDPSTPRPDHDPWLEKTKRDSRNEASVLGPVSMFPGGRGHSGRPRDPHDVSFDPDKSIPSSVASSGLYPSWQSVDLSLYKTVDDLPNALDQSRYSRGTVHEPAIEASRKEPVNYEPFDNWPRSRRGSQETVHEAAIQPTKRQPANLQPFDKWPGSRRGSKDTVHEAEIRPSRKQPVNIQPFGDWPNSKPSSLRQAPPPTETDQPLTHTASFGEDLDVGFADDENTTDDNLAYRTTPHRPKRSIHASAPVLSASSRSPRRNVSVTDL